MDASLSIGLMSPGWPREAFSNGIVTYVATVAPQLRDMGHRVAIVAAQVADGARDGSVYDVQQALAARSLVRRAMDGLWYRIAPGPVARRLTRRAVVETARRATAERALHLLEMEESFGWAYWVRRAIAVPVCVRLHGPWFLAGPAIGATEDDAFRIRLRDEGRAIATADAVSAPARDVLQRVRAFYGIGLEKAEVIPNPTAPVPPDQRWTLEACQRRRVLFVGRFDRLKGGDLVVEAFARVLDRVPEARLWLVGPDGECRADDGRTWSLEDFVRHRLPGALESRRVQWLGRQPFSALASLRRQAFACVVCSRYETYANTVIEAMALGCPVVAAGTAGIPEIVEDGVNGVLHRPGDAGDLGTKLVELLEDPARAAQLGRQAAADCQRLFYPDAIALRLVAFYRRVLAGRV